MIPTDHRPPTHARDGLIGKALLWVIGIPLLIVVFALAALVRHAFAGPAAARPAPSVNDAPADHSWQR